MTCLCGREDAPKAGEPVQIGDVVGFGLEPGMRYGRVVGRVKKHAQSRSEMRKAKIVVREFRPGDGRWPSGHYLRSWLIVPWAHRHPQTRLFPEQEPMRWAAVPPNAIAR